MGERPIPCFNTAKRQHALDVRPEIVGVTSFDEWHEGTQILPAVPKRTSPFTYDDYTPLDPDYYIHRTAEWVRRLEAATTAHTSKP